MNFKEKAIIAKQKKEDGGGQSTICPKHKIKMQIVSIGTTHAQVACPKCQEEERQSKR